VKRSRLYLIPVVIIIVALAGCPAPEKKEEKAKPATPEEIRNQGQQILQQINQLSNAAPQQMGAQIQQVRTNMQTFRDTHGTTKEGQEMIQVISTTIYNNAFRLFQMEDYFLCIAACDMVLTINPGHARTLELRKQAEEERAKPKVQLTAFYEDVDAGRIFAFVEVTYPATGQRESRKVEVGAEFDGYRFKQILPNRKGIILRYIKTGKDVPLLLHP